MIATDAPLPVKGPPAPAAVSPPIPFVRDHMLTAKLSRDTAMDGPKTLPKSLTKDRAFRLKS